MPKVPTDRTQRVNELYQAKDADIDLISSDDVLFKVHADHLSFASPVFRAMLQLPNPAGNLSRQIPLTDNEMEGSDNIETFLDLVYTKPMPHEHDHYLRKSRSAIPFLQKYECGSILFALSNILRGLLTCATTANPCEIFLTAATMDDIETCHRALSMSSGRIHPWPMGMNSAEIRAYHLSTRTIHDFLPGTHELDLTGMSWSDFKQIPPRYAHALLRASRVAESLEQSGAWKKIADEFERLLSIQPKPKKLAGNIQNLEESGRDMVVGAGSASAQPGDKEQSLVAEPRAISVNEIFNNEDADVHLISSDGMLFKVHSYRMRSASPIFRSLLEGPSLFSAEQPRQLVLTDKKLEVSGRVLPFLRLLYGWDERPLCQQDLRDLATVVPLARKYECEGALSSFKWLLRGTIGDNIVSSCGIYILAAGFTDNQTCKVAIAAGAGWIYEWPPAVLDNGNKRAGIQQKRGLDKCVYGGSKFDLSCMRFDIYAGIPMKYAHLLLRATHRAGRLKNSTDWRAISKEFERLADSVDSQ